MTLRIGIVSVQAPDYHPNRRLLEAAGGAGYEGILIHPYEIWPHVVEGKLTVTGKYATKMPRVILPRQGAQIGESSLALIRQLHLMGLHMVNGPEAIFIARDKFLTQQVLAHAGLPCLDTVFINRSQGFFQGVERLGGYPVVVKPTSGRQGEGVMCIAGQDDAMMRALPLLDGRKGLVLQRYLPTDRRKDIRAVVIGKEVVCAGALTPVDGEFRSNFHLGAVIRPFSLSADLKGLALAAAATVGCDVAGVDMMIDAKGRPNIVEVNYSPGFAGMEAATDMDIAGRIVRFAVQSCRQRAGNNR